MIKPTEGAFQTVSFRCPRELFELIQAQANHEDRSISNLVIRTLRDAQSKPGPR